MPLLFDVAGEQAGEGVFEAAAAREHVVQVFGDGHADAVLLGERVGVVCRAFAFDDLADGSLGRCRAFAASQGEAEAAVA